MPKVSINILTKNREELLQKALASVSTQTFNEYEIVVVNDGSSDNTSEILKSFNHLNIKSLNHSSSAGITLSRQEALHASTGEYVAILDDDAEWIDTDKLQKQVDYLNNHPDTVLVGGGIVINPKYEILNSIQLLNIKFQTAKSRPETNKQIRNTI